MRFRRHTWRLIGPLTLLSVAALTACSSSGSDSPKPTGGPTSDGAQTNSSSSASGGQPGVAAARAAIAKFSAPSTDLGITVPLTKAPPKGKVIYDVNIQNPLAVEQTEGLKVAAKVLGWTVKPLYWTTNPADANKFVLQAVQAKADFIVVNAVPDSVIASGTAAAKKANIPVFLSGSTTVPRGKANWVFGNINDGNRFKLAGQIAANQAIASSNGSTHVLSVDIAGFDVQKAQTDGFKGVFTANCPGCKYEHLGVSIGDLGTPGKPAATTVAYIRTHPGIKRVVFGAGGMAIGFAAAAKQAGLSGITVTTINGLTLNLAAILKGDEEATVSEGLPYLGWLKADAMARYALGMDLTPNWNTVIPELIQTKDNISGPNDEYTGPKDYQASFTKLWQLG